MQTREVPLSSKRSTHIESISSIKICFIRYASVFYLIWINKPFYVNYADIHHQMSCDNGLLLLLYISCFMIGCRKNIIRHAFWLLVCLWLVAIHIYFRNISMTQELRSDFKEQKWFRMMTIGQVLGYSKRAIRSIIYVPIYVP